MTSTPHSINTSQLSAFELVQRQHDFQQAVQKGVQQVIEHGIKGGKLRLVKPPHDGGQYVPRMDLIDDPALPDLKAVFELPGIKASNIALNIREGHLIVTGERRSPYPSTSSTPLPSNPNSTADVRAIIKMDADSLEDAVKRPVHELSFGSFRRVIRMPLGLKESDITAGLQEGMLTVSWPRSPVNASASDASRSEPKSGTVTPPSSFAAPPTSQ